MLILHLSKSNQVFLSGIKKLAGQTLWYGLSSIFAKFINYLLTPYLTLKFSGVEFGEMSVVYAAIPFLNVVFTYGMETAFFRFSNRGETKEDVFNTTAVSLLVSTVVLTSILILLQQPIASLLELTRSEYLTITALIVAIDAITAIPFAKLRQDDRPVKYALVRVGGILINIATLYFFISVCPRIIKDDPSGIVAQYYRREWVVGYVLLANLVQAVFTFFLLAKEFLGIRFNFNSRLWKEMLMYSAPLILAGFAGMINETFDRIMLLRWAPVDSIEAAKAEVGTYSACYKLSILITLAVQAFRMGAEPFFFKQASSGNAAAVYARVMKFFVITLCLMFLFVMLYIDVLKYFIQNPIMHRGLGVVPVLLLANIFLGIYYNLSIWYKLGHKTSAGAYITLIGAAITIAVNYFFIPRFSFMACAWATFFCYGSMMVVSYVWGQKVFRVPYAWARLSGYIILALAFYFIHVLVLGYSDALSFNITTATTLMIIYLFLMCRFEKKEFARLPVIGKYLN